MRYFKRATLALFAAVCLGGVTAAFPQAWPTKPVRLIVPYAPGGVYDQFFRAVGQQLSPSLGQPVIVENKPGANTAIGTASCAKGTPDGYTYCSTGNSLFLNDLLQRNLPFDSEKELAPVTNLVFLDGPIVAHHSMPFNSLKELVDYAKKNPGKLNFGSFGEGSAGHLYIEWIKNMAGIDVTHIAYKGAAQVIQAVITNEVQLTFMATGAILPHIKAGKAKPIVMPAPKRSPYLPDVPTIHEQGYDFRPTSWIGLFTTAGTPRPIVERMQQEIRKVLDDEQFRKKIIEPQFYEPVGSTPSEFAEFLKQERKFIGELVRVSGVKPVN